MGLKHAGEVLQDVDGFFQHRMLLGKFFSPAELTSCLDHQQNKSQ